jgi:hypothetical protein
MNNPYRAVDFIKSSSFRPVIPAFILCAVFQALFAQSYSIYYGNLHGHTGYSDGQGTPAQAFEYAKNSGLADFMALTDHSTYPDQLSDQEWEDIQNQADAYTDDTFVAMPSWEMTRGWGHMNTFNIDWVVYSGSRTEYYDMLANDPNAIGQWNHPTDFTADFEDYADHTPERDRAITLIEIMNGGNTYEDSYIKALDAGWHVAPSANSDTHSDNWITGWAGRTAVLAESRTREAIYDGLSNRRVYGTRDSNIRVRYGINDSLMGSIITNPPACEAVISIEDPDESDNNDMISSVEVITSGGDIVETADFDDHNVDWNISLDGRLNDYFFLKITNGGGQLTYTAPVWIDWENNALDQPIVVSSEETGFEGGNAVDGDEGTSWTSSSVGDEYIYVDLGETYDVSRVVLDWDVSYAEEYVIEISPDAENWFEILNETAGEGGTEDLSVMGTGQYLRLTGITGSGDGYTLKELEAYGTPSDSVVTATRFAASSVKLNGSGGTSVEVYSLTGKRVRSMILSSPFTEWDGRDDSGNRVRAGMYVARVRDRGGVTTRKVVVR